MTKLLEKLTEFFKLNYSSDIECFINSKRPTNNAEVEFWLQQYNRHNHLRGL